MDPHTPKGEGVSPVKFQGPVIPVQLSGAAVIWNMPGQPKQRTNRDFPGGPGAKTPRFQYSGSGSIPRQGT